jgi:hypothetical protein
MNPTNPTASGFEDFKVNIKIKLSALWASVTLLYLYGDYFELYVPKKVEGLISGESMLDSPMKLFAAAVLLVVPSFMVFLSVVLKPTLNRRLNIAFGIFYTALMMLIAVGSLTPWRTFYVFLALVESVITSLIVWYAIKWPRQAN